MSSGGGVSPFIRAAHHGGRYHDRLILFYEIRDIEMLRILTGVMSVYRE